MKLNIQDVLRDADFEFTENRTHIILKNCPNCDGKDKLWFDKRVQLWQCFKCKGEGNEETKSGNLWKFLVKVIGLSSHQAKVLMQDGEEIQYTPEVLPVVEKVETVTEEKKVAEFNLPSNYFPLDCSEESVKRFPQAYKYLISRNVVSKQVIRELDLRFDPAKKRILFPAYKDKGVCIGYQGRDITDRHKKQHPKCQNYLCTMFNTFYFIGERTAPEKCPECGGKLEPSFYPKSVNSKNFPKMEFFFNQQNVDWTKPVVLVEGPFDSVNTPNSIGLMGRALSEQQFYILKDNLKSTLILYLDGDSAGTDSIKEIYNQVCLFVPSIMICLLEDGEDPGTFSREVNSQKLKTLLTMSEWCSRKNQIYLY